MSHQRYALKFIERRPAGAGIFMAPGTGKTLVFIRRVQQDKRPTHTLVICRRDDFLTWETELALEDIHDVTVIDTARDPSVIAWERGWVLVTYDLVKNPAIFNTIRRIDFDYVVSDESQMIKRWSAERTKQVIKATRHISHRFAMTGSPITNDPGDVWAQCMFIDDGKLFGSNYYEFRNRYYLQSGPGWYIRRGAKEEIQKRLAKIGLYVHEDDALRLPPIRHVIKGIPLSGMQRRHYERALSEWETTIDTGETIEFDHIIVQLSKLRQIASGFIYKSDKVPHWFRSTKLDLLLELVADPDYIGNKKKVVIWCAHTAEIIRITSALRQRNQTAVTFFGSNRKRKNEARQRFYNDPDLRFFVGQVDSGVGMNELLVADTAIYFSNSFRVVSRQQSMRRIRRKGSERHKIITYWDLISEGTADRVILSSVESMMNVATEILNHLKQGHQLRDFFNVGSRK